MKHRNRVRNRVVLSLSVLTLIVLQGQACGQLMPKAASDLPSTGVSGGTGSSGTDDTTVALPEEQLSSIETVRVVHKQEFVSNLHSMLDLPYAATVWTSFTTMGANLSEDGYVDSVTAPMMNSILTINGVGCSEQIKLEKAMTAANRKVFKNFDFTKSVPNQSSTAYSDLVHTLSRRAWLRDETTAERTAILDAAKIFDTTVVADTEKKALFICSAMLSSLDAITR